MKRKLINWDVFEKLQEESLSSTEFELVEAAPILAKALNLPYMELKSFGTENVMYETSDGEFVHSNFHIDNGNISFENIEELVLNEDSEISHSKKLCADMLEAILSDKKEQANQVFEQIIETPYFKRTISEEKKWRNAPKRKNGKIVGYEKVKWNVTPHHSEPSSKTNKRMLGKKRSQAKLSDSAKKMRKAKRDRINRTIADWAVTSENVIKYVDYKNYGPTLNESKINYDERGNINGITIPLSKLRNEAKLLSFDWKVCKTDVEVLRSGAKKIAENMEFCKAMGELKAQNNISDNDGLHECLEKIVSKWPSVLYLTQDELSETIKYALETIEAKNFDDQTCDFMAEGILRTAHDAYVDSVNKVIRLAGTTIDEAAEDKYLLFKNTVDSFYPNLDESNKLEMQVYVDLYEALRQVWQVANEEEMHDVKSEVASYLNELSGIIEQSVEPSLELAQEAAEWLQDFVETNLEMQDWNPSNSVHVTLNGDHPAMSEKARKSYTPASDFSGDWGSPAPVSDGKSYKGAETEKMRSNGWANVGGDDVYPTLSNPYVPKGGMPKIAGEKDIDGDNNQLAHAGGSDTWPALTNPYVPKADVPKMNHGKESDLVVDA